MKTTQSNLRLEHIREHVIHRYHVDLSEPASLTGMPFRSACGNNVNGSSDRMPKPTHLSRPLSPSPSPEIDWEFVQTAIAEMTERLDAMGPVNLEAIQEYDELEERQKFLDDQHADLVKSKSELLDVINKINATTKELFADTFEQVQKEFSGDVYGAVWRRKSESPARR